MRRIFLILAVVALMAATMVSGPAALAKKGKGHHHGKPKVTICHNGHTIKVGPKAAKAHLAHHPGDYAGPCVTM